MESNKLTKLKGQFELDNTYESNNWIRVKIRTFAFGENRNASDIKISSMSEFNNAKNTIGAIPIVARYNPEQDNLEGHNVVLRKDNQGEYEWFHDTDALGFTSPTTSFHFEVVNEGTDIDPDYKTYVVVEDVYLWKRFDSTKKILEWFSKGIVPRVSMEIDRLKGEFNKSGIFQIEDFEFTGICALGTDVEPCFPKAEIQMYTLDEFKSDIKALFEELSNGLISDKGGNTEMEDVTQVEVELEATEETTETEETVVDTEETFKVDETVEDSNDTDTEKVEDTIDDEVAVAEVEEENPTTEVFTKEFVDGLNDQISQLTSELEELKSFKRSREEQDLADKFTNKLTEDEIKAVFEASKDLSLNVVEEKLMAKFGQKNFSLVEDKSSTNIIALNINKETKPDSPYGDFFK